MGSVVISTSGEYILLKYIESMNCIWEDAESQLSTYLKDDIMVRVCTISGKEYIISANDIAARLWKTESLKKDGKQKTSIEMWKIILDNWISINTETV